MNALRVNLVVVALVLVSSAAFAWGLLIPGEKALRERYEQIDRELDQVSRLQDEVGSVSDLYASIVELNEQVSGFRKRLPAERKLGEFLSDLTRCLETAGIADYSIQPRPARDLDDDALPEELKLAAGTTILPVVLSFDCEFDRVFRFLSCVEALQRVSKLEKMELINEEHGPGHLRVSLVLHAYHHPED